MASPDERFAVEFQTRGSRSNFEFLVADNVQPVVTFVDVRQSVYGSETQDIIYVRRRAITDSCLRIKLSLVYSAERVNSTRVK